MRSTDPAAVGGGIRPHGARAARSNPSAARAQLGAAGGVGGGVQHVGGGPGDVAGLVRAGPAAELAGRVGGGPGGVAEDVRGLGAVERSGGGRGAGPPGPPPAAQRAQAEPGVQRLPAVPDLRAVPVVHHPGQRDRVPGRLAGPGTAVAQPHQQPGRLQAGEELRLGPGAAAAAAATSRRSAARAAPLVIPPPCSRARPGPAAGPAPAPARRWARRPGSGQRRRSLGRVRSGASFPPPNHTGSPAAVTAPSMVTAYPVTSPGLCSLYRSRTRTPRRSSAAKNSGSDRAPAAAAATCRRSVTRGGSACPARAAFSDSARVGLRAAVRSGPGHDAQPVLGLDVAHRRDDLPPLVVQAGPAAVLAGQGRHDVDVVIAVVDRDPPHPLVLLAVAGQAGAVHDLRGDPHPRAVAQLRVLRRGADRAVPHRVGRGAVAEPAPPAAASARSACRKSRCPSGRSGGSSSAGWRQPETRCGLTCSHAFPGPYR